MLPGIIGRMQTCPGVRNEQSRASAGAAVVPRMTPLARSAGTFGLRSPAMIAVSMARPETPGMSLITPGSFRCASAGSFCARCFSAVRARTSRLRQRVCGRSRRMSCGGTKLPAGDPRPVTFAGQAESGLPVFGRPGSTFTCDAWDGTQPGPARSGVKQTGFR